jgi:signal transduction histidine kinase/CheY-like chemotaxis protein
VADPDPGEPSSALTVWRAATLGSLIAWDLACATAAAAVLSWMAGGRAGYSWLLWGGWGLVAMLAMLLLARRLEWRVRAALFLAVNYGVMLLASTSGRPGPVAFSHAAAVVALAGLLLGGRAAAGAALLIMATLSAVAVAVAVGWAPARTPLDPAAEWTTALAGAFPPLAMVVVALYCIVDRLRDSLSSTTRALRDLQATRSQVADSERAELAGRLATALAHDLNNTLMVVVASADWLAERLASREEAEAAAQICEAAHNASTLTQQVLLASGSGMSQPRTLDLARVTAVAASALRRLLPPDIRVETRMDGPVWTLIDPGMLQQVILSLALTARAAMPGGGTLLLAVRPGGALPTSPGDPPPAAILEVSDTGFGMDAEERRRAFEPLSDRSVRRGGVGLYSVKGLVEAAGGQVLLRSRPGTGTVVTLSLPGALPTVSAPTAPGPARPGRVLVVEDDIRVRALVCTALEESGHEVSEVSDGTQAMSAIEELGAIDLLVTDVVMPGAPIGEVIATFRARHPGGKVLLCSAFSQDEPLRQPGMDGHHLLRKPFTRGELLAEVHALLSEADAAATAGGRRSPRSPASTPRAI